MTTSTITKAADHAATLHDLVEKLQDRHPDLTPELAFAKTIDTREGKRALIDIRSAGSAGDAEFKKAFGLDGGDVTPAAPSKSFEKLQDRARSLAKQLGALKKSDGPSHRVRQLGASRSFPSGRARASRPRGRGR